MAEIEATIDVEADVRTAYNQWTQFETFPRFMNDIESVEQIDANHLHWVAVIGGRRREWDAEITEQVPDRRIVWRSLTGPPNDGEVTFEALEPSGESPLTRVSLAMLYDPNDWVAAVGEALGLANARARTHLKAFKAFIEGRSQETGGWRGEIMPDSREDANALPPLDTGQGTAPPRSVS